MTDTKKSCSVEQQMAEDEMFRLIEKELGCDVDRNVRVTMDKNRSVHIEPDFYSEEHGIIGEIFAHIGRNKRGQTTKIANDILKMLLLEKDRGRTFHKIIIVCDRQEEKALSGNSALAESIRQFGIELRRVKISDELKREILAAQSRQIMRNG